MDNDEHSKRVLRQPSIGSTLPHSNDLNITDKGWWAVERRRRLLLHPELDPVTDWIEVPAAWLEPEGGVSWPTLSNDRSGESPADMARPGRNLGGGGGGRPGPREHILERQRRR